VSAIIPLPNGFASVHRKTGLRPVRQTGFQPIAIFVAAVYDRRTSQRPAFQPLLARGQDGLGCSESAGRNRTIGQQTPRSPNEMAGSSDDLVNNSGLF
jgi:hypothetical protein